MPTLTLRDSLSYSVGDLRALKDIPVEVADPRIYSRLIYSDQFEEDPPHSSRFVRYSGPFAYLTLNIDQQSFFFAKEKPQRITRRIYSKLPPNNTLQTIPLIEVLTAFNTQSQITKEPFTFCIIRNMGAGDVLIATSLARELKQRFEWISVHFSTFAIHRCLLQQNPDLDGIHLIGEVNPFQFHADVNLCEKSEQWPFCTYKTRAQIYADEIGLPLPAPRTRLVFTPQEFQETETLLRESGARPRGSVKRVTIQPHGSGAHRSLLPRVAREAASSLVKQGFDVLVYHQETDNELWEGIPVINLSGKLKDVRQAAAVIACSDLWMGPDSFGGHAAASLDPVVPALWVFTTINPALRLMNYEKAWSVISDEKLDCRPCFDRLSQCGGRLFCRDVSSVKIIEMANRILNGTMPKQIFELPVYQEKSS